MTVALLALVLGVPAALFVVWPLWSRRGEPRFEPDDDPRAALEAEKVLALRALRELELDHANGLLADPDYTELQARYEARASAILERLDRHAPRPRPAPAPAPSRPVPWTQRPIVLGASGVALLLFGAALGMLVVRHTDPAPPEPAASAPVRPIPKAMLQGMLQAARASFEAGRYDEAAAAYGAVLKREPDNVEALTHFGGILVIAGHPDQALEHIDRALALEPDHRQALWYKAGILYEVRRDYAGAVTAWERFVQLAPPGQDRDLALVRIREAKARLAAPPRPAAPVSGSGKSSP